MGRVFLFSVLSMAIDYFLYDVRRSAVSRSLMGGLIIGFTVLIVSSTLFLKLSKKHSIIN